MNIIFTGTFWGVILILLGVSVILKTLFNIDIPVFRTMFGVIIVLLGISIVMGKPLRCNHSDHVIFGEGEFHMNGNREEFNVLFGKGVTDLRQIQLGSETKSFEVNTVCGENIVYYDPRTPVKFRVSVAFGEAKFPNSKKEAFGKTEYKSPVFDEKKPHLNVSINVVCGSVKIIEKE